MFPYSKHVVAVATQMITGPTIWVCLGPSSFLECGTFQARTTGDKMRQLVTFRVKAGVSVFLALDM